MAHRRQPWKCRNVRPDPNTVVAMMLAAAVAGCGAVAYGPAYTQEELAQQCAQRGGWWRPDELMGGHCEFEADGFM
ncbi:MAG TPA: hypothetical protein VF653_20780 [Methylomirabilota bacterium]